MTAGTKAAVPVGKTLLLGFIASLVTLAGNVIAAFVTNSIGSLAWFATPVVGVLVSTMSALVIAYAAAHAESRTGGRQSGPPAGRGPRPGYQPGPNQPWGYPPPHQPPVPPGRRRGKSLGVTILIGVLLLGGGALGVTIGVRYAVGWISGSENGPEYLVGAVSQTSGSLTLTVDSVQYTSHFTRVGVVAQNDGDAPITLPLFENCILVGDDGTVLKSDSFRSDWSQSVPGGGLSQRGTITFSGQLPAGVSVARLSFVRAFGAGQGGWDGITITGLQLEPPG